MEEFVVNLYDFSEEIFCDNTTIQIMDNEDPSTTPARKCDFFIAIGVYTVSYTHESNKLSNLSGSCISCVPEVPSHERDFCIYVGLIPEDVV